MRIFVAGGTGVVGRRAVALLARDGHDLTVVARTAEKAAAVRASGAEPVQVDLFDAGAVKAAVAGHEAVVNLATGIPTAADALKASAWTMNERIRREASANLADAALAAGAARYVQESITFPYADRGDAWIDESVPFEVPALIDGILHAEAAADRFTAAGACGVVLRFAQFYAPEAAHTRDYVKFARRGVALVLGRPGAYISSIHADDAASAVMAALHAPAGRWNVADDEPVTKAAFAAALASALGRRRLIRFPGRLAGWSRKAAMLRRSQRVSNRRFREATGWTPAVPSVIAGWPAVVAAMEDELVST